MSETAKQDAPEQDGAVGKECECFGDSGLHASTYVPLGSDREHCDLCGYPVPQHSADVLSSLSKAPA